jgi:glutathione peroxidase
MNPFKAFLATLNATENIDKGQKTSIYNIRINTLQGELLNWDNFKGKYILIVNVASKCGFTSQYEELQKLYETYNDRLEIIGVPCNQFGQQEPGDASEIKEFCQVNFGVSFTMTEKINVKGSHTHPLYTWLTQSRKNGLKNTTVKWNFQKYLINKDGYLVDYFYSITKPDSNRILKYLK